MSKINWNSPNFRKISKEKKQILMQIENDLENIPPNNTLAYLVATITKFKQKGIRFSNEEMDIIQQVLTQNMSEKEKQKFILLKNLL